MEKCCPSKTKIIRFTVQIKPTIDWINNKLKDMREKLDTVHTQQIIPKSYNNKQ